MTNFIIVINVPRMFHTFIHIDYQCEAEKIDPVEEL